jgi:hypothetical protein
MSIYTYIQHKSLCETLGIEFHEIPSLSDQILDDIVPDFPGNYRPYGGGGFGFKHTDEWKKDKSISMIGDKNIMFGKTHTFETRKKISEKRMGILPWNKGLTNVYSDDTITKMKKPKSEEHKMMLRKSYLFLSPSGEIVSIFGLNEFCKKYNLSKSAMSEVHSGKRNHYKKWKKV